MLKKTITYNDPFTNEKLVEDFYFNYSTAELLKKELVTEGGYGELLQRLAAEGDPKKLIPMFDEIIKDTYGERRVDPESGKTRFVKSPKLSEEFMTTEAYSVLFFELSTVTDAMIDFVNGVMPVNMDEQAEMAKKGQRQNRPPTQDHKPKQVKEIETLQLPREDVTEPYFDQVATNSARDQVRARLKLEQDALAMYDEYENDGEGKSMTEYGFSEEQISYLRTSGLV